MSLQPPEQQLSEILRRGQAGYRLPSVSAAVYRGGEVVWAAAVGNRRGGRPGRDRRHPVPHRLDHEDVHRGGGDAPRRGGQGRARRPARTARAGGAVRRPDRSPAARAQLRPPARAAGRSLGDLSSFRSGAELVGRLADAELVLPAGERWHYSNLAYALLGEVVARVADAPFSAFVDERLIGPCALRRTTWRSADSPRTVSTSTRTPARSGRSRRSKATARRRSAASGARRPTSAGGPCHLASIEAMHQVQIMDDPEDWTLGHGLGLQLVRRGERVFFGHGGAMPGFLAMLLGRRREGVGAALATNASTPSVGRRGDHPRARGEGARALPGRAGAVARRRRAAARGRRAAGHLVDGGDAVRLLVGGRQAARPAGGERQAAGGLRLRAGRRGRVPGRPRAASAGELLASCATATAAIEKLYWATYPVTREPTTFG